MNEQKKQVVEYTAKDGVHVELTFDTIRKFLVQGRAEHSGRGCGNPAAIEQLQAIRAGPSDRSRRLFAQQQTTLVCFYIF